MSYYYPDEGEWGTSGGVYLHEGSDCLPVIAFPTQAKWGIGHVLGHELTHHALHGLGLPLWAEEGLTQMMEERVTGTTTFRLDREIMSRHRDRWPEIGFNSFLDGDSFHSPHDDEQELAYHLSQVVVRGWLAREPAKFFAFLRACKVGDADSAAEENLGGTAEETVRAAIDGVR